MITNTNQNKLLTTVPLEDGETISAYAGGQNHSLACTSRGRLFAWGSAENGKLGLGGVKHLAWGGSNKGGGGQDARLGKGEKGRG